jgi:hypothetical protein
MIFILRLFLLSITGCISISGFSQKIIGSAMADENGITQDQGKAKFLVVEKQINDSAYERLDYNFAGPMISRATFLNKDLKILNGDYADYHINGYLATTGQYVNYKKDGNRFVCDDISLT